MRNGLTKKLLGPLAAAALLLALGSSVQAKPCIDCDICQADPDLPMCQDPTGSQETPDAPESLWELLTNTVGDLFR